MGGGLKSRKLKRTEGRTAADTAELSKMQERRAKEVRFKSLELIGINGKGSDRTDRSRCPVAGCVASACKFDLLIGNDKQITSNKRISTKVCYSNEPWPASGPALWPCSPHPPSQTLRSPHERTTTWSLQQVWDLEYENVQCRSV